jgi:hypothetical protein
VSNKALADRDAISGFAAVQRQLPWLTGPTGCAAPLGFVGVVVGSQLGTDVGAGDKRTVSGDTTDAGATIETQQRLVQDGRGENRG